MSTVTITPTKVCASTNKYMEFRIEEKVAEFEPALESYTMLTQEYDNLPTPEWDSGATTHYRISGSRAEKSILERITSIGLVVATTWVLLTPIHGLSQANATPINLLNPKNGGQVVVASSDAWLQTIDGNESRGLQLARDDSAIYAFKNERSATFDTFAVLIPGKLDKNLKEFELLTGDSPTGEFSSIGKFTTVNAKFVKNPYQEFKFPPVTAKYLKVQLLSNWGFFNENIIAVFQFRLMGQLKE
jgi:hypothetical protein